MYLLRETGIACVPGEAFYHDDSGEDLARFCFAKDDPVVDEWMRPAEGWSACTQNKRGF